MRTLFGDIPSEPTPKRKAHPPSLSEGPFAGVAMENAIDKVLDYSIPPSLAASVRVGQRVKAPLGKGNRSVYGYIVSIHPTTNYPRIKPLMGIDDPRVLVTPQLMTLARWMSRYYVASLGTVLESIIPSAVKKKVGMRRSFKAFLAKPRDQVQAAVEKTKAPKRRAILARMLQLPDGEGIELVRLAGESGATLATIRKLAKLGWIALTAEREAPTIDSASISSDGTEADIQLNEDQQRVFDDLRPRLAGGFSVNLLQGVTGSGKTEIYLQCIRQVVARGCQAILLVPEIALTPQTVRRFTRRFRRVAILHSGLSASDRHRYWQQIATGQADVIVGARSAIFAPVPKLGMIVVDEEHEASYKQDSAPRYHGRDVAIKRAQIEGTPILLGSATPSLETWRRVQSPLSVVSGPLQVNEPEASATDHGQRAADKSEQRTTDSEPRTKNNYHLLILPRRVRGLAMPHVELIDMKQEGKFRRGVHLLSQRLEHLLKTTLAAGQQAILLLNRRGYSNFVYCPSCQSAVPCRFCDTTMTYHRSAGQHVGSAVSAKGVHTGQLHCHYCMAVSPLPEKCPTCGKGLTLFGLGTQRVEEELTSKFPEIKFARVDSDSMRSAKDYEALLGDFADGKIQVLLGTQMIAKGLDYPNVTLVGVISGDTALALPDFRAAERTFQLITQVAGRAGRGDVPGRVVLQTFLPDDPTIQSALRQDFAGFAGRELAQRREVGLPPYVRMARIILRDRDPERLHQLCDQLAGELAESLVEVAAQFSAQPGNLIGGELGVRVQGPMPCAISRIAGYHRNQIVLSCPRVSRLQAVLASLRKKGSLKKNERIAVDVDPVSLL